MNLQKKNEYKVEDGKLFFYFVFSLNIFNFNMVFLSSAISNGKNHLVINSFNVV